jgi:Rrf2 family transcriptional regulator, cysteine metabolism repressor
MRISKKAEYALRALAVIARQRTKSWSIQELSDLEHIPLKFLEQILLTLRHAGVLASKRGVRGGYTLVRMPENIRLGEVIALFDGPLAPVPCAGEKPTQPCTCPDPRTCPLRQMMTGIRHEMAAMLESRTIEDLAKLAPTGTSLAFDI